MVNIAGIDEIRLGLSESTDLEDEIANFDIRYDGWRSATGFNWQRTFGSRGVGLLGITHSEAKVGQQVKDLVAQGVPPPGVPPEVVIARSPVVYFEDSREGETTIKYDLTVHLPFFDTVQAGGSFKTFRIDYTAESPYGNDTPYSPVPGIDPFFLDTRFRSYQTGAYLQASKQVASRVNVTLGGRFDHYDILSQARFSPRAGVKVRLTDALSWNSSAGSYYQQPAFLFVSAFPQNASLVPWRADHYVTGLAWSPAAGFRVTAEAYRKTYTDYPVASDLPTVSLANIGDTFDVREILFPLTSAGEGHSEGVEIFVEKRLTSKLYGQGNLSFSRTRHAGLDGVLQARLVRLPVRVQPARRLSAVAGVGVVGPALVSLGPAVHALRPGGVHGTAARRVRPHARQRRACARLRPRRHPRGPHVHRGRAAAQPVRWRTERDQPPQLRQLQLEPPHQHPAVRRAARHLPDPRLRLAVLDTMSRVFAAGIFIGVLLMSTATLRAGPAQEPLRVGDRLPALKGQFLTGRDAVLPQASSGQVALVAIGFTYKSRVPVEAWADWYRTTIDPTTDVTFFEVPMIGGLGTLGRWFIDRGMRKGTPVELHDHVITVYGGTGDWKQRLAYSPAHEDDAYLVVLDREGVVRWLHHGGFDTSRADELKSLLASLVRPVNR